MVAACGVNQERENGVDCCGEEDGGYDNDCMTSVTSKWQTSNNRERLQKYCTTKKATR